MECEVYFKILAGPAPKHNTCMVLALRALRACMTPLILFAAMHSNCPVACRYAGVLLNYLGVEEQSLSLWCYTWMSHFFLYLSFVQARGVMNNELKKQVQTATLVLGHLGSQHADGSAQGKVISRCIHHLANLSVELGGLQQRASGVSTNPPRQVLPAGPVLAWQEKVIKGALHAAEAEVASTGGHIFDYKVQTQVRDATLLGLAFGHATLVSRLTLLRSLRASQFSSLACGVEGCVGTSCKGNRLERVPNPSFAGTSSTPTAGSSSLNTTLERSPSLFKLCCAHHKNSSKGVPGFEVIIRSPNLHALLVMYEQRCRGPLLMHAGRDPDDDPTTLFFTLTTGKPVAPIQMDSWFRDLQIKHDLPVDKPIPQSHLRHILTSHRREQPNLPGPKDEGAALGMGNSPKVRPA